MKYLICFFLSLFFSFSTLAEELEQDLNSREAELVQVALQQLFSEKSLFSKSMCQILNSPGHLFYTTGLDIITATHFSNRCDAPAPLYRGKIFQKKYFKYNHSHPVYGHFYSWTNQSNATFLRSDVFLDLQLLKTTIMHELAIGFDAKTGVFFNRAYLQQKYLFDLNQLNRQENLDLAFKKSQYLPISQSFAALRAFYFEYPDFRDRILSNHQFCQEEFLKVYNQLSIFKDDEIQQSNKISDVRNLTEELFFRNALITSQITVPDNELQNLTFLLDANFKVNSKMSYCQFMAYPYLSNRTHNTFSASGPRPNMGGGWETSKSVSQNPIGQELNVQLLTDPKEIAKIKSNTELNKQYRSIFQSGESGQISEKLIKTEDFKKFRKGF